MDETKRKQITAFCPRCKKIQPIKIRKCVGGETHHCIECLVMVDFMIDDDPWMIEKV